MKNIYFSFLLICLCACSHSQRNTEPAQQIDGFTTYYMLDHWHSNSFHYGMLHYINLEFPTDCADKEVLTAIQQDLIRTITDTLHSSLDSALAISRWGFVIDSVLHLSSPAATISFVSDSLYHYGGIDNWYDARSLTTTYNKNGIYACKFKYDFYDGRAHNTYGTDYAIYSLETGEKIKPVQSKYTLGLNDSCLIIHYNPGVIGCEALGEKEIVIPTNVDSLVAKVKIGSIDSLIDYK